MAFLWGLTIAPIAAMLVGCIDDRPSGPGRIRDSGGSMSESSSGSASSGGGTASGGTGSGGQVGSGGETASVPSSSGGRDGTSSSHSASSGGAAASGGETVSSHAGGSSAGAGQGGTSQSSSPASSGGSGGSVSTASSSVNHDAGVPPRDASAPADAAGVVSFANQIQPMLKSNCTSCHGSSQQSAGVRLDSYNAVKTNLSKASNVISKGIMPPSGGLKTDLRQLFQTWVDQGALNN